MIAARNVAGRFRSWRYAADLVLVAVLVGIPWIRLPGGEPLMLLDIPAREFHVFGLVIVPQELYFLWLILAGMALALFFFTALLGRVWCGWACPQTVFTDVFAILARWIQGWKGPRPPARIAAWRRVATHAAWIAVSALVGFHLVGYFVSPYELLERLAGGGASGTAFTFLGVATALCYVDFAIVKQAFCKTLCPYARFQFVLFDADTLVVGYDTTRGEPRGKRGVAEGDCVDCGLCVQVCPTAIDIRKGMQLECITCTQCIDACNGVMRRIERPEGLIDYRSLSSLEEGRPARIARPRVLAYGGLIVAVLVGFTAALAARTPLDFTVAHNRDALFGRAADGRYGNAFDLRVENRAREPRSFHLRVEGADDVDGFSVVAGQNPIPVPATGAVNARIFVMAPQDWEPTHPQTELRFLLEPVGAPEHGVEHTTHFLTPERSDAG